MRETFGTLTTTAQNYTSDSSSASKTILQKELNNSYGDVLVALRLYVTQEAPAAISSEADTQFYSNPVGVVNIQSATMTIGGVAYPLQVVNSQASWDFLNQVDFAGMTIPQFIFPRKDDFGIYPIPNSAGTDDIQLNVNAFDRAMTADDVSSGTVTVTNADATVAHSATDFTAAMVGRWFKTTVDQFWYRILTFTSTSSIELNRTFMGSTLAGAAYTIGESPEIPEELHQYLPHRAASMYYLGPRKDATHAIRHSNVFWTGDANNASRKIRNAKAGILAAVGRYGIRSNRRVIKKRKRIRSRFQESWRTTLT